MHGVLTNPLAEPPIMEKARESVTILIGGSRMVDYREFLRYQSLRYSQRQIGTDGAQFALYGRGYAECCPREGDHLAVG